MVFVPGVGVMVHTSRGDWLGVDPNGSIRHCSTDPAGPYLSTVEMVPASHVDDLEAAHQEHITDLRAQRDGARGFAETAVHELCEVIRRTAEYVGPQTLPAIDGWSWFDALVKYAPDTAQAFVRDPEDEEFDRLSPNVAPAPALLDPGNPEHLRQVADFVGQTLGESSVAGRSVGRRLREEADSIAAEKREAEQDAADQ